LLFHPFLGSDEAGEISVNGNVSEQQTNNAANQRPSFVSIALVFVIRQLAVEGGQENAERIHERDARHDHHLASLYTPDLMNLAV
jgi:hypothetical protein